MSLPLQAERLKPSLKIALQTIAQSGDDESRLDVHTAGQRAFRFARVRLVPHATICAFAVPAIIAERDGFRADELKTAKQLVVFRNFSRRLADRYLHKSVELFEKPFPPRIIHVSPPVRIRLFGGFYLRSGL